MSDITQPTVILTTDLAEDVAPGGIVSFSFAGVLTADDLLDGQLVYLTAYSREFHDLAVTLTETSADVTWPADAPYPLPVGEYNCEFETTAPKEGGGGLPPGLSQVAAQPVVTLVAQAVDSATIDLVGLADAYNTCVAAHDELATAYNGLLAAMQASGVMAASAVATKSKKTRK